MKQLIVNADDYGLSVATNSGILRAHTEGIVTAATMLVGLKGFEDGLERCPQSLDLGLHFNITWGRPVASGPLPTLAPGGEFLGKRGAALTLVRGRIQASEIEAELRAQIGRFAYHRGLPSHIDVHQHFHMFPAVWGPLVSVAVESGIPWLRFPAEAKPTGGGIPPRVIARLFRKRPRPSSISTTDHFQGLAWTGNLDLPTLTAAARNLPNGLSEWMVHPGDQDPTLEHPDRLASAREAERDALTHPGLKRALDEAGIQLTSFRDRTLRGDNRSNS